MYRVKVYTVNAVIDVIGMHMVANVITLPAMPRKPVPPSEKKIAAGTRLDPQLFAELDALAKTEDRTMSYLIEKAVRQFLEGLRGKARKK